MDLKWGDIMNRYFISKLEKYEVIGFDLDGTIYDEFAFISQAYIGVAKVISEYANANEEDVYKKLCDDWIKFGSSKVTLFQDVFSYFTDENLPEDFINDCLKAFRNWPIKLELSLFAKEVFDFISQTKKELFLVTDGNSKLQRKKINSLGLNQWIEKSKIAISGDYGKGFQKPSPYMASDILKISFKPNMVYLGDRDVDMQFAKAIGADFIRVKNWKIIT